MKSAPYKISTQNRSPEISTAKIDVRETAIRGCPAQIGATKVDVGEVAAQACSGEIGTIEVDASKVAVQHYA